MARCPVQNKRPYPVRLHWTRSRRSAHGAEGRALARPIEPSQATAMLGTGRQRQRRRREGALAMHVPKHPVESIDGHHPAALHGLHAPSSRLKRSLRRACGWLTREQDRTTEGKPPKYTKRSKDTTEWGETKTIPPPPSKKEIEDEECLKGTFARVKLDPQPSQSTRCTVLILLLNPSPPARGFCHASCFIPNLPGCPMW